MCGVIGIMGKNEVVSDLLFGLNTLQHRGQNSCGIATFKDIFHLHKGLGGVNRVFTEENLSKLKGNIGLGHIRYATQGTQEIINAQPFTINYPFGIAMIHNGNVINFNQLKKTLNEENHILIETTNDLELILYTFSSALSKKDLKNISPQDVFEAVEYTQQKILGAYATVSVIANQGMLAFCDPYGIRPLVMGKKETEEGPYYCFASESTTFDYLGYENMGDLEPGEAVFIDNDLNIHRKICRQEKKAFCIFEYIYFSREDSIFCDKLVANERMAMGKLLSKKLLEKGLKPDIVIDVPASAYFFATSLAEELGVPYRRGLSKNNHIGRSFTLSSQKEREQAARLKINPIKEIIKDKKVAIVDDSIVRGTTSKNIVKILKNAGAKEIYFISAAPPIKHPCIYGIDMAITSELIGRLSIEEIKEYLEVDEVIYQDLHDLKKCYEDQHFCYACFSGDYPVTQSRDYLDEIEYERIDHNGIK